MATIVSAAAQTSIASVVLTGVPGTNYVLPIRVRGVCGLKLYTGGVWVGGNVYKGGTPAADNNDVVKLVVSSPSATYYFNYSKGGSTVGNVSINQVIDIIADGVATLTLTLDNINTNQYQGDTSDALITVPGFTAFDGIWAQLDTNIGEPFVSYGTTLGSGSRNWVFSAFAENVYGIKAEK